MCFQIHPDAFNPGSILSLFHLGGADSLVVVVDQPSDPADVVPYFGVHARVVCAATTDAP